MTTPPKPAPVIERAGRTGVATVATPGGGWLLDWEPQRATFTAAHLRQTPPGWPDEVDCDFGCRRGEIVSPLALEEALRFALPLAIRTVLGAERDNRPALSGRRAMRRAAVEVAGRPRPADTFPLWSSPSGPAWGPLAPWGLSLARDQRRNVATVNLGDAIVFEILERCSGSGRFSHRVGYRFSAWESVVFSGDDMPAPNRADLDADDIVRAVMGVISRRPKPLAARQEAFLETLAEGLLEAEHSGFFRSCRANRRRQ